MRSFIIFSILLIVVVSCKKPEDRKCWKSAGEESSLSIDLPDFKKVWLGPQLNFIIVQDTVCRAVVKGGKNLLNFVSFEMVDGEMRIANHNKCSFLRSYKKELTVELHIREIEHLQFEGTKPLTCQNKIVQDYMSIVIRDGAGKVNIDIDCINLNFLITHGWGNFDLKGNLSYLKLESFGSGFGSTYDLNITDSVHVVSSSSNDLKINAEGVILRAQTKSIGDIYYRGQPSLLEFNQYGDGELINDN